MFGIQHFALFLVSGALLILTPGQDTFYIVGRSVSQGRRAGLFSALGVVTGTIFHTLAAAFGLSAILAASPRAFVAVKFAGAAYLVYLGLQMLLERQSSAPITDHPPPNRDGMLFRAGLLTNVLNPKVALFFLAFLPQFVAPDAEHRVLAFLLLGGIFVVSGTLWCVVLVYGSSAISRRFRARGTSVPMLKRLTGAIFVALGVRLAVNP